MMKKGRRLWIRALGCVLGGYAVSLVFSLSYIHPLPLLAAVLSFALWPRASEVTDVRARRVAAVTAALFAFFIALGNFSLLARGALLPTLINLLAGTVGFYFLLRGPLRLFYNWARDYSILRAAGPGKRPWLVFAGGALLIFGVWFLFFLQFYPGISNDDTNWQLMQALGQTPLSNHHPIAHTMLLKGLISLGTALLGGDLMRALAFASVAQMLLLAALYAFFAFRLYRRGLKNLYVGAALAFFALVPYNIMYSFTLWKDTWFAAFVLLFGVMLWDLISEGRVKPGVYAARLVTLFLSGVGVCLFRSNGYYAFLVLVPLAAVVFFKKQKPAAALCLAAAIVSGVIQGPVYNRLDVVPIDPIEYLSIPAQQIANVVTQGGELTAQERALLEEIVNVDTLPYVYYPRISDAVKNLVRETDNQQYLIEHKGEYLKLWLALGARYPVLYLQAYVDGTLGYYYLDVTYWTLLSATEPNTLGLSTQPLLGGGLSAALGWWLELPNKTPVYAYVNSIGAAAWGMILAAGACWTRGRKKELLVFVVAAMVWLTTLVTTPVFTQMRYVYALVLSLPLFAAVAFASPRDTEKESVSEKTKHKAETE